MSGSNSASNETHPEASTTVMSAVGCSTSNRLNKDGHPLASVAMTVGVVLLCENILLITVIARTRSLHTNTNILVASLAITDVLVGAQVCAMGLSEQPEGLRSWLGLSTRGIRIFDSFLTGLNFSLVTVSICHLAALALDRYLYVLWPLHYHIRVTRRRVIATAAFLWLLGLIYLSTALILFRNPKYHVVCVIWQTPAKYGTWPLASVYFLCMCVVFASTLGLAKIALKHKRKRQMFARGRNSSRSPSIIRPYGHQRIESDFNRKPWHNIMSKNVDNIQNIEPPINMISLTTNMSGVVANSYARFNVSEISSRIDKSVNANLSVASLPELGASDSKPDTSDMNHLNQHMVTIVHTVGKPQASNLPPDLQISSQTGRAEKSADSRSFHENNNFALREIGTGVPEPRREPHKVHAFGNKTNNNISREITRTFSKENVRIIKFIFVMCGCFLLCTLAPLLSFIIEATGQVPSIPSKLAPTMFIMLGSNSGMNFIIITYMNKDFRAALLQTLPCCKLLPWYKETRQVIAAGI